MKKRITLNLISVVLFVFVIFIVPIWWLVTPDRTFSDSERRNLTQTPTFPVDSLNEWNFDDDIEEYLADQLPLRELFVGINGYETLLTGRQVSADIYYDREGYLVEKPLDLNFAEIEKRVTRINRLSGTVGIPVRFLVPPSTGFVRRDALPDALSDLYLDDQIFAALSTAGAELVPLLDLFSENGSEWFYRTDHHWNSDGAYAAYVAYMSYVGKAPLEASYFLRHTVEGYVGSTRSRSALWLTSGEQLVIHEPPVSVQVAFSDREGTFNSLIFAEHLKEYDWYPIFVDGNHPITVIENLDNNGSDVLFIVKDSFANSIVPLFVPSYKKIVMVDPRYYRGNVSELCIEHNATELLFCYSLERITTDTNLLLLK